MATSIMIEEESGTWTRVPHPHNGYWAGSFGPTSTSPAATSARGAIPLGASGQHDSRTYAGGIARRMSQR